MAPRIIRTLLAALACLAISTPPAPAEEGELAAMQRIKVEAGAAYFDAACRRCHATDEKHESYGPSLMGIIGRKVGSVPDYPYSEALTNAGFVWTEPALKAWMADNQGFVPGTKMRHVGITDPVEQEFILAWLRSETPQQQE